MVSPAPGRLTVSDIRQKIFEASGTPSQGLGSLPGQLFHRVADCAFKEGHPAFWQGVLTGELSAATWARALYDQALGPELMKLQAAAQLDGSNVLQLWRAVESFAKWFCGVLAESVKLGIVTYDPRKEAWLGCNSMFEQECDLSATLREPGWTSEVIVAGRADHLLKVGGNWCIVEFKLGGGHAEADAAQACLYHELLGARGGSAALLHFNGNSEPDEILLSSSSIAEARPKLLALIGSLAGVSGTSPARPKDHNSSQAWPKAPGAAEIELGRRLLEALHEFNADAEISGTPLIGPTFVRYLLEPGRGVTTRRIESQGSNLQTRLQLQHEPMISIASGRIAVDLQRAEREYVPFGDLRPVLDPMRSVAGNPRLLAGIDLKGTIEFIDLSRDAPHLLVAGTPGSGKSEWLRSAAASLMVTNAPNALQLVLIDPKRTAFTELKNSPYLWRPDALLDAPDSPVAAFLLGLIEEMQCRNELFAKIFADDLAAYQRKSGLALPRIVCFVDEYAELLMARGKKEGALVEERFVRIAQLGRAAGIHLVLATQRPSRQVISGVLKANVPGRVALRVATQTESRVILDQGGAENLLGRGDLLLEVGSSNLLRLQSAFLREEDRKDVFSKV